MQRCSVEGCAEWAVVAPLVFGWTGAAGTYATPGLTYTNAVDRAYCGKHNPASEQLRLFAEVERLVELDDLLGLAMAVANGWPNESAPPHIREEYIEALRAMATDLLEQHVGRVAFLRAQNAAADAVARPGASGRE